MSQRSRIDQAIDEALESALPELTDLDRDATLSGELGLDSVQIMGLVMEVEDRLDISIPVEVLAEVQTLNQLSARLAVLLGESKP